MSSTFLHCYQKFTAWCHQPLGQAILRHEWCTINKLLLKIPGQYILQYGIPGGYDFLTHCKMEHHCYLLPEKLEDKLPCSGTNPVANSTLYAEPSLLPLANNSIDAVLLPHTLECTDGKENLLAEVARVLTKDGYLILTGFNAMSLWGIWQLLPRRNKPLPLHSYFPSVAQIRTCIQRLDFDIVKTCYTLRHFPFRDPPTIITDPDEQEHKPCQCWHPAAASWIMVARKCTIPITPMPLPWRSKTKKASPVCTQPASYLCQNLSQ